ncbi:MAG: iron-sulfur cluster assembly scaffold protein, partial [bacterium]|nr:iron-sulfur cluster assembly scaffold protein [bacterium]
DIMEIYIKVNDEIIDDIKLKTFGCGSAIATASMITEMAKGMSVEDAGKITRKEVANKLDGLPPVKMHCSNLAADALQDAIENYRDKQKNNSVPSSQKRELQPIDGEEEFRDKGVYYNADDPDLYKDKRIMIMENGDPSAEMALKLAKVTPRVVLLTSAKEIPISPELKVKLKHANVKVLCDSKLLEIGGYDELEKARIHDLYEDEEYELFIDVLIIT